MKTDAANGREKSQSADAVEYSMMDGAQFEMMMGAHRALFERIEAINRDWLAIVRETNKTGSDLALRLVRCKNLAETQALCDAWLRDCATRLTSFSRHALGSWIELQRMALSSALAQAGPPAGKSDGAPAGEGLGGGNGSSPLAAPSEPKSRPAEFVAKATAEGLRPTSVALP